MRSKIEESGQQASRSKGGPREALKTKPQGASSLPAAIVRLGVAGINGALPPPRPHRVQPSNAGSLMHRRRKKLQPESTLVLAGGFAGELLLLLDQRHQPLLLLLRHAGKVQVVTVFAMGPRLPQQRQKLLVLLLYMANA